MVLVIGNISEIQAGECKYPAAIQKALHFLAEHDFAKMQDGKYPIDGDNSFAILQRYARLLTHVSGNFSITKLTRWRNFRLMG